jgi:hypothetical protein
LERGFLYGQAFLSLKSNHFVMAITSAEAIVPHPATAEMDEQGEQAAMAKKKRHSRVGIATKLKGLLAADDCP